MVVGYTLPANKGLYFLIFRSVELIAYIYRCLHIDLYCFPIDG